MTPREQLAEFFFAIVEDPTEEGFAAARQAHPEVLAAALAYLRDRHVHGAAPEEDWETAAAFHSVLRMILGTGGPTVARDLVELALDAGHPAALRPIGELVLGAVPPDALARALIDALGGARTSLQRDNARALAYHTFDAAGDEYAASDELRTRLDDRLSVR